MKARPGALECRDASRETGKRRRGAPTVFNFFCVGQHGVGDESREDSKPQLVSFECVCVWGCLCAQVRLCAFFILTTLENAVMLFAYHNATLPVRRAAL